MSNNKQSSSVDFIHDSLIKYIGFEDIESTKIFDKIFEQAKAMEKKQCVDFALKCMLNGLEPHQSTREVVERLFDESLQ